MNKIYLLNAIMLCVLFFIEELSAMCYTLISRLRIHFPNYHFNLYHVFTPGIPVCYEHGFIHRKKIDGPDI